MSDQPYPKSPDLLKYAPWIAVALVIGVGGPSLYCLVPYYMGLTEPGQLGLAWSMVWLVVVPAISFLIAHVIAGVGNLKVERPAGSGLNGPFSGSVMVLLGVVLPVMAMIVLVPGLASLGFREDPGFTLWHVLLIAIIPIGIVVSWEAVAMGRVSHPRIVGPLIGAALAVSATYALLALSVFEKTAPLLAVDPRATLILTPPLAFLCAIFVYRKVRVIGNEAELIKVNKLVILGFAVSLGALFIPEAAPGIVRDAISDATAKSSNQRRAGVRLLRGMGLDETVLRYCYREVVPPLALSEFMPGHRIGGTPRVKMNDARAVYYRVTGKPFNTVPRPGQWGGLWLRWSDTDLAGEQVGAKADGLSLSSSAIEGSLDANTSVGYIEWTLAFANASLRSQEARALIELPPGAVVSRVTLFVDGKPREATFNNRTLVRKAYQAAVVSVQDPLLVTQVAPDRVLVQCYPVPPQTSGDAFKILLGVSMPLPTETGATRLVKLPRIVENNFAVAANHRLRLTSLQPVAGCNLAARQSSAHAGAPVTIEGQFTDDQLLASGKALEIRVTKTEDKPKTPEPAAKSKAGPEPAPGRLFVVIDGSQDMSKHLPALARALKTVPKGIKTEVLFASDEITALSPDGEVPVELSLEKALNDIPILPCRGGPDNTPALFRAWQRAWAEGNAAVLWIHGPQPTLFDHPDNVVTSFRDEVRQKQEVRLYEMEVEPGPNKLIEAIESASAGRVKQVQFRAVPRLADVTGDLQRLFGGWTGQAGWSMPLFDASTLGPQPVWAAQPKLASAMRSLRAHQQVRQLLDAGKPAQAGSVAAEQRIVSPVTGAVVLAVPTAGSAGTASAGDNQITAPPLVAPAVDTGIFKEKPIERPRVAIPPPVKPADTSWTYTQAPFKLPEPNSSSVAKSQDLDRSLAVSTTPTHYSSYGSPRVIYRPVPAASSAGDERPRSSISKYTNSYSGPPSVKAYPSGLSLGTAGQSSGRLSGRRSRSSSADAGGSPVPTSPSLPDAFSAGDTGSLGLAPKMQGATKGTIGPLGGDAKVYTGITGAQTESVDVGGDAAVITGINTSSRASVRSQGGVNEALTVMFGAHSGMLTENAPGQVSIMVWVLRAAIFVAVVALLVLMLLPVLKPRRGNQ